PTHLIESFKSTLDEVRESDILLHVVDISHPQHEDHIRTVNNTLKDLNSIDKPTLFIFNKIDRYRALQYDPLIDENTKKEIETSLQSSLRHEFDQENIFVSAITGENIDGLRKELTELVRDQYMVRYPHQAKQW
ncbi:MAG: GTPase HflX, partial [Saprospiraceae bacterium]|nr:GTPase HflX [Saprospiraceae bacterium]